MSSIFENAIKTPGNWLLENGPNSDIVLSCRIRLARNLKNELFPHYIKKENSKKLKENLKKIISNCASLNNSEFYEMSDITHSQKMLLLERHLISKELAEKEFGMLAVSSDEKLSIMVNEEDHLRLQAFGSGLQLSEVWEKINKLDDELAEQVEFAYSEKYGFLTACPTNVGTGMRCSILVHLPGIILINQLKSIHKAIEKLGLTIRGYYGEGSEAIGNFFQISNQITLGLSEEQIIDKINNIGKKIVEHEENARKVLLQESKIRLEDQIYRALGILKNARIISTNETMSLLSFIRLAVDLKIIKDITISTLNKILVFLQPSHLQKIANKKLSPKKHDFIHAKIIHEKFSNTN